MITFWLMATLLVTLILAVLIISTLVAKESSLKNSRDAINKAYYDHRLLELVNDEEQGVISERDELVKELQQNLLADIPLKEQQKKAVVSQSSLRLLLPVIIGSMAIGTLVYAQRNNVAPIALLQDFIARYPQLLSKYNSIGLKDNELSEFALGLRDQVYRYPDNLNAWINLGEVGVELNNLHTAIQAFGHAYRLAPNNSTVEANYGRALLYSRAAEDNQLGRQLLYRALQQDPKNIDIIRIFAFTALEAKDYPQAFKYWQMWLDALPEKSPNRALIESMVEQIKKEAKIIDENKQLTDK